MTVWRPSWVWAVQLNLSIECKAGGGPELASARPPPRPAPPPEALFYLGSWASLEPLSRHTFFPGMEPAIS